MPVQFRQTHQSHEILQRPITMSWEVGQNNLKMPVEPGDLIRTDRVDPVSASLVETGGGDWI